MIIEAFCDGGSRGNPGPAAYGFVVYLKNEEKRKLIYKESKFLGYKTNNQAEYEGLLSLLRWLKSNYLEQNIDKVIVFLDSELVYKQILGLYKTKNKVLKQYLARIKDILAELPIKIEFRHVLRGKNKEADALLNKTLNAVCKD